MRDFRNLAASLMVAQLKSSHMRAKETPLIELAKETAIVASLALQSGCPLGALRHGLAGRDVGPLGEALSLIGSA